jgi:hypothetical protein
MLNLTFMFDDANRGLTGYANRLAVFPLPAAVYLMQRDVINHYDYALDHYFTLTLQESFLQNSSIGPPYQKWAYFTNADFGLLSFTIHNLLRYTSRLGHETEFAALADEGRYSEMGPRSNTYTHLICEIKYRGKRVGVSIEDNNRLIIVAARIEGGVPLALHVATHAPKLTCSPQRPSERAWMTSAASAVRTLTAPWPASVAGTT